MSTHDAITKALALIFAGIDDLKAAFPNRQFTIDGRLVGDIGEIIAALEYDVVLHETSQPNHDADTSDGRRVQIKATFKDSLTLRFIPDYYLGFKLFPDGQHQEIFNGPGQVLYERYKHRKGIGEKLLPLPVTELQRLATTVPPHDRIPLRKVQVIGSDALANAHEVAPPEGIF